MSLFLTLLSIALLVALGLFGGRRGSAQASHPSRQLEERSAFAAAVAIIIGLGLATNGGPVLGLISGLIAGLVALALYPHLRSGLGRTRRSNR
jgi:hypothetical protein